MKSDIDIYLDIQHVWQLDPENKLPKKDARKICAIACMKMLIDYLPPEEDKSIKLSEIQDWLIANNGRNVDGNWVHPAQVNYFKKIGYSAWRRNWNVEQIPQWFLDNEGYDQVQYDNVVSQIKAEDEFDTLDDKIKHTLVNALRSNTPVITSIKLGFDEHGHNHQIVLSGYKKDSSGEYFYINDPMNDPDTSKALQLISVEKFLEYFNRIAIFAKAL